MQVFASSPPSQNKILTPGSSFFHLVVKRTGLRSLLVRGDTCRWQTGGLQTLFQSRRWNWFSQVNQVNASTLILHGKSSWHLELKLTCLSTVNWHMFDTCILKPTWKTLIHTTAFIPPCNSVENTWAAHKPIQIQAAKARTVEVVGSNMAKRTGSCGFCYIPACSTWCRPSPLQRSGATDSSPSLQRGAFETLVTQGAASVLVQ